MAASWRKALIKKSKVGSLYRILFDLETQSPFRLFKHHWFTVGVKDTKRN